MNIADVGVLPTLPPPDAGERLRLSLPGRPPAKTISRSMRNPASVQREQFMTLRHAAIDAMAGRKWYEGSVRLLLTYRGPESRKEAAMVSYLGGILDTIGGSHAPSFIYLPIVYLDDCQVDECGFRHEIAPAESYDVEIDFLADAVLLAENVT